MGSEKRHQSIISAKNKVIRFQRIFPRWWPTVINSNASVFDADEQEEYKTEAYRVVRGLFFLFFSIQ